MLFLFLTLKTDSAVTDTIPLKGLRVATKITSKAFSSLPPQHKKFVLAYLKHFNATQAYIDAGYDVSTRESAMAHGSRLVGKGKVRAAIADLIDSFGATPSRITEWLLEIAAGCDMADFEGVLEGERLEDARAKGLNTRSVKKIRRVRRMDGKGEDAFPVEDTTIELYDRLEAIEKLGRIRAMFTDKLKHEGEIDLSPFTIIVKPPAAPALEPEAPKPEGQA